MRHFDDHARKALVITCGVLVVCGLGFYAATFKLKIVLQKESVELRQTLANIPKALDEWRTPDGMQDGKLTAEIAESLGTDIYLDRRYERQTAGGMQTIDLHIAYYTGMIDAVPHVPDRCFLAGGWVAASRTENVPLYPDGVPWKLQTDTKYHLGNVNLPYRIVNRPNDSAPNTVIRMPIGELKIRVTEFSHPDHPDLRAIAGYFFIANGEAVPTPEGVRAKAFDLRSRHAYYAKIQISMQGDRKLDRDDYMDATADIMTDLLPEIMLCLPDWAEIEQVDVEGSST